MRGSWAAPTRGSTGSECAQLLWHPCCRRVSCTAQCAAGLAPRGHMRCGSLLSACARAVSTSGLLQLPLPSRAICCVQRVTVVVCGPVCCLSAKQELGGTSDCSTQPCAAPGWALQLQRLRGAVCSGWQAVAGAGEDSLLAVLWLVVLCCAPAVGGLLLRPLMMCASTTLVEATLLFVWGAWLRRLGAGRGSKALRNI